jgi:4-aminobutyrate aminotransferase-like enzyme
VGNCLLDGLNSLEEKHPIVGDVLGLGLYVGIELATNRQTLEPAAVHASYIINRAKD